MESECKCLATFVLLIQTKNAYLKHFFSLSTFARWPAVNYGGFDFIAELRRY